MSRVGRMPIRIPSGVEVAISGSSVTVKGPKGKLARELHPGVRAQVEDGQIVVTRPSDGEVRRSLHGLTRSLLANMVTGVTEGFEKTLELSGVGYRAARQGNRLLLMLGYSRPVEFEVPQGLAVEVPNPTTVVVRGIDKEAVGQFAALIRASRDPDPYKAKGVRYAGEFIRRKAGKAGKK